MFKLLENNDKMYDYQICKAVKSLSNDEISIIEGALYSTLNKLEDKGIIEAELIKIESRVRKYYKLTEKGKSESIIYKPPIFLAPDNNYIKCPIYSYFNYILSNRI